MDYEGWLTVRSGRRPGADPRAYVGRCRPGEQLGSEQTDRQRTVKVEDRSVLGAASEAPKPSELPKFAAHIHPDFKPRALQSSHSAHCDVVPGKVRAILDVAYLIEPEVLGHWQPERERVGIAVVEHPRVAHRVNPLAGLGEVAVAVRVGVEFLACRDQPDGRLALRPEEQQAILRRGAVPGFALR